MTRLTNSVELGARVFIGVPFLLSGLGKLGAYAATAGYMASQGVPGFLLPLVIATEVGGSLAVILGWRFLRTGGPEMLRAMESPAGGMHEHATDPVCGMTVDPATASEHTQHGGATYYFCSAGCREAFEKDPARYLAGSHAH